MRLDEGRLELGHLLVRRDTDAVVFGDPVVFTRGLNGYNLVIEEAIVLRLLRQQVRTLRELVLLCTRDAECCQSSLPSVARSHAFVLLLSRSLVVLPCRLL